MSGLSEEMRGHFGAGVWRERAEAAEARVAELEAVQAQLRVIIAASGPERLTAAEAEVAEWKRNFDFAVKHHHGRTLAAEAECARLRDRLEAATELLRRYAKAGDTIGHENAAPARAFLAAEDREELERLGEEALRGRFGVGPAVPYLACVRAVLDAVLPAYDAMRVPTIEQAEEYASEGWAWVETFCGIVPGVDDVFKLRDYLHERDAEQGETVGYVNPVNGAVAPVGRYKEPERYGWTPLVRRVGKEGGS